MQVRTIFKKNQLAHLILSGLLLTVAHASFAQDAVDLWGAQPLISLIDGLKSSVQE